MLNDNNRNILDIMKDHIELDQPNDWQVLINVERQRICQAESAIETDQSDLQFIFSINLSCSTLYYSHDNETNNINLSFIEKEQINFAITNISNPILRIIAQSIIVNIRGPFISNFITKFIIIKINTFIYSMS